MNAPRGLYLFEGPAPEQWFSAWAFKESCPPFLGGAPMTFFFNPFGPPFGSSNQLFTLPFGQKGPPPPFFFFFFFFFRSILVFC